MVVRAKEIENKRVLRRKLSRFENVLIVGIEGSGKTEFMRNIEGRYREVRNVLVVGTRGEHNVRKKENKGTVNYVTKKGNRFLNYGEVGNDSQTYKKLGKNWLMYDGIRNFTDLNDIYQMWRSGTGIVATIGAQDMQEAETYMQELGTEINKTYGVEMNNWLSIFSTVVEVKKGWGGTPYEVVGVYDIRK